MAARIVHFGIDQCQHLAVLSYSGCQVEDCGTSISKLSERLQRGDFDAVAVSGDGSPRDRGAIELARSQDCRSLILFEGIGQHYDHSQFDLVVPWLTPAPDWLKSVAELIERSRAIRMQSTSLRRDSEALREESAELRAKTAAERARAKQNLQADVTDDQKRRGSKPVA